MTFDATSREFCTVRRVRTNTPLQALTLLNDEAFFEAARALAARTLAEVAFDRRPERARAGQGSGVARVSPQHVANANATVETARIVRSYEAQLRHYRSRPGDAAKVLKEESRIRQGQLARRPSARHGRSSRTRC